MTEKEFCNIILTIYISHAMPKYANLFFAIAWLIYMIFKGYIF
jgi:hypothetical protein